QEAEARLNRGFTGSWPHREAQPTGYGRQGRNARRLGCGGLRKQPERCTCERDGERRELGSLVQALWQRRQIPSSSVRTELGDQRPSAEREQRAEREQARPA